MVCLLTFLQIRVCDQKHNMHALLTTLAALAVGLPWAHATSYDPLKPPSYPLAVRSPYLSGALILLPVL